ncbi:MAG: acyl-CoA thioesterase [Lachnospiraceae bacterium]|nr:acyl-CoA thioesterase [Lachnospiraceae bacterium]
MKILPYEHKVQYYETDKMGIVHHSNYIRWFEEARVDFLDQVDMSYTRMEEQGVICPVMSVECHYHSMTHFGENVLIYPKIEKFNGIRLIVTYEVKDKESGELRCTGRSVHCYLDKEGHPVSLKKRCPEFYEVYKAAEGLEFLIE